MGLPGTSSSAIQNPDGTWDVLDVPIVPHGAVPLYDRDGQHVDDFPTTREWFQKVITTHRQKERGEGYMGRAFLDHHDDDGNSNPDAGFLRPTRVGTVKANGKMLDTLFIDLVSVPDDIYQNWIKTGRMPYRSIESYVPEDAFIDGLALMATRKPHFQMPMLTIGEEVPYVPSGNESSIPAVAAAIACASSERAIALFKESPMPEDDKKDDDEKAKAKAMEEGEETAKGTDEGGEEMSLSGINLSSIKATAEEWGAFIAEAQAIAGALGGDGDMAEPDSTTEPVAEQDVAMSASKKSELRAVAAADMSNAKVQALERRMDTKEAVNAAVDSLSGFNIGSDPRAILSAHAKKHGINGLAFYVSTVKAGYTPAPGSDEAEALDAPEVDTLPKEVMAYTDPTERGLAVAAHRDYEVQVKAGWPMGKRSLANTIQRAVARGA